jgi:formate hydrogenlyase subunit 6/NADH:ubiquinone oxidoreductase subunit I
MATSRPDVFAGGDVAFGPRIIITAVAEGKKAANSIAKYLTGRVPAEPRQARVTIYNTLQYRMKPDYEKLVRRPPPTLPLDRRIGIAEVEKPYPEPDAHRQADRCLKCHVGPVFDGDECVLCGGCADVCPEFCLRLVDAADLRGDEKLSLAFKARYGRTPVRGEQGAIIKDETRCIRCGLCAVRCPTGAITMERVELLPATFHDGAFSSSPWVGWLAPSRWWRPRREPCAFSFPTCSSSRACVSRRPSRRNTPMAP